MITTPRGELRKRKPVLFQESSGGRRPVEGGYRLAAPDIVSFEIGHYDPSSPLVIDPLLSYSTYFPISGNTDLCTGETSYFCAHIL